jgi:hypothetical protein
MQNQKPQKTITSKDLGELHPKEIELIWLIRHQYRFGVVELQLRDGLPQDILKTVNRHRLGASETSYPQLNT